MGLMNKIVSRATGSAPQHDPQPTRPEQPPVDRLVPSTGSLQASASRPVAASVQPSSPRLRTEIASLKAQLEQCQGELAVTRSSANHYAEEATGAKKDLEALNAKHTIAAKHMEAAKEALSKLKLQAETWEEKFSAQEAESAGLKGEVESLQGEIYLAKQSLTLRDAHQTKVRWTLAEDGCTGQIPASLFDSISESAPAALYAGRYQAPEDEAGRIFVDCDPIVWRQVLNYARCQAVPPGQQPELLAQARMWNIDPLVQTLEARIPGVAHFEHHAGYKGFTARFNFVDVTDTKQHYKITAPRDEAWGVFVNSLGIYCSAEKSSKDYTPRKQNFTLRLLLKDKTVTKNCADGRVFPKEGDYWGFLWHQFDASRDELIAESTARSAGCAVVELQMNDGDRLPL